jgi:hypothetical protein
MACHHCGFQGDLDQKVNEVVKRVTWTDERTGEEIDHDTLARVLICPSCEKLTVDTYKWSDLMDPLDVQVTVLYPEAPELDGLPDRVRKEFGRAQRVRTEPVFYAVAIRRTLEAICAEEGVEGRALFDKLKKLSDLGRLPDTFVDMATILRQYGNLGAHESEDEPTEEDVSIVADFADAILEYLYRAPAKVAAVQNALKARQAGS